MRTDAFFGLIFFGHGFGLGNKSRGEDKIHYVYVMCIYTRNMYIYDLSSPYHRREKC